MVFPRRLEPGVRPRDSQETGDKIPNLPQQDQDGGGIDSQRNIIHILISSPLLLEDRSTPVEPLSIQREVDAIVESLKNLTETISLEILVEVATSETLHRALTRKPKPLMIHFMGHGIINNEEIALLLEDKVGIARPFREQELGLLLDGRQESPCQIAILNACYSEKLADVLVRSGIPHVIAIKESDQIRDLAARCFSQNFYHSLFTFKSVLDGFLDARKAVLVNDELKKHINPLTFQQDINLEEYFKFQLLPGHGHDKFLELPSYTYGQVQAPIWGENTNLYQDAIFVGRRRELHQIAADLDDDSGHCCIALHGMGGMGKTVLAKAAGRWHYERNRFRDGVWFIELRSVSDVAEARYRIVDELPFSDDEKEIVCRSNTELAKVLSNSKRLLILDDLDELIERDEEELSDLLNLLSNCRGLKLLLTSREDLSITVRHLPREVQGVSLDEATQIFKTYSPPQDQWRGESNGTLDAFNEVLQFLDGYPLALRLAASYLQQKRCDIKWLAKNLWDSLESTHRRPSRETSLNISLDLSYNILPPDARDMFPRLAIFPGGLSRELATFVWGKTSVRGLEILLQYSMAEKPDSAKDWRVTLPEPARQYAESKQIDTPMDRYSSMILDYFYELIQRINEQWEKEEITDKQRQQQITLEQRNLKHFLSWGYDHEQSNNGVCRCARVTVLLGDTWQQIISVKNPLEDLSGVIHRATQCNDKLAVADLFHLKGDLQRVSQGQEVAQASYGQAIELYESICKDLSDALEAAQTQKKIAQIWEVYPDLDTALKSYQQSIDLYEQAGESLASAQIRILVGDLWKSKANTEAAQINYQIALECYQTHDDQKGIRVAESRLWQLQWRSDVDYTQLETWLSQGDWQAADRETERVMLQVIGREETDWIRPEELKEFPCQDLQRIDQLWRKYSQDRFGFSIQKRIFINVGGIPGQDYDREIWRKFGDQVGWLVNQKWLYYSDLNFSLEAPEGHLPVLGILGIWKFDFGEVLVWDYFGGLFSLMETCKV